jgi:signal transduction histidine kinase
VNDPAQPSISVSAAWTERFIRVLLIFRGLVLFITLVSLPKAQRTPVVGLAVIAAALVTYVPLRHWKRISRSVERHPMYLFVEVALATLILAAAGAHSAFFYFTLGTGALAGVIYGRRGAIPCSALLIAAYEFVALEGFPTMNPHHDIRTIVFAPLLYPVAVAAGVAARELIERGVATETLLRDRTEALSAERERLRVARELHDSLAKTVEGLAMTASVLPGRCERDPASAVSIAKQLVADARQAAIEARALMSDLRPSDEVALPLLEALRRRAEGFGTRFGIGVRVLGDLGPATGDLPAEKKHEVLRIIGEAVTNACRHGGAEQVTVTLDNDGSALVIRIADDGRGLSEPVDLERLKAAGHFGIAGMHERARLIGATLTVENGSKHGAVVTLRIPASSDGEADNHAVARKGPRHVVWRRRLPSVTNAMSRGRS